MIFKNSADWPASEENCVAMGGHLASVHSSEEHTFIVNLVLNASSSDSAWIGGSDTAQEGAWVWTDGSAFSYTYWNKGEPSNYGQWENCMEINYHGKWNDLYCKLVLPSVCAKCQDGWLQFKSHCFKVFTTNENFKTSEENCVSAGGHLASMHSNADNVFIKDLVWNTTNSNAVTWIGARDAGQLGKWVWTDGSAFDYSIWSNGQPDKHSPLEQCVEINYLDQWNDANCDNRHPSVCAKRITSQSANPSPVRMIHLQLKMTSNEDLMASNIKVFAEQLKEKMIKKGLPNNFTLYFKQLQKKSP
uniref:C-type lectin domain-containing protein n=1 Tax=Astyanax mexicanus TaxID=7994 RepID=A0A3B1JQ99_ASTMX